MRRLVFYFDVETTGLNAWRHSINQLAGILEVDGQVVGEFNELCAPVKGSLVEPKALEVQGRTLEEVNEAQSPLLALNKLQHFLDKFVDKYKRGKNPLSDKVWPCAYNGISFDMPFLHAFFERQGDEYIWSYFNQYVLDPIAWVQACRFTGRLRLEDAKLATVYERIMKKPLEGAHDALADVRALRAVARPFLDRVFAPQPENGGNS